jgi:hypothetical protein
MDVDLLTLPTIINVRDRYEPLRDLISWLERAGIRRIVLVDNRSSYPPLLQYLGTTDYEVVSVGRNLGQRAPWLTGTVQRFGLVGPYVVSDPDVVPDPDCPLDVFDHFARLLERYPEVSRVGFGLRIDDLPEHYRQRDHVIEWEAQFWESEIEPAVYLADIDTTFALYRPGRPVHAAPAIRTGWPYVARHVPWYENTDQPTEDERWYRDHLDPSVNSWNQDAIPGYLEALIGQRSAATSPEC